jgi:hypothetical protein
MLARTTVVGLVWMRDFRGRAAIYQGNFVNGSNACAADTGNLAQIQDKIAGRVFINFMRLIDNLDEIRRVDIALKAHNGHRLARLLKGNSDFHVLSHLYLLTEIEFFIMNVVLRDTQFHKFFLERLHHRQWPAQIHIMTADITVRIFQDVFNG